MTALHNTNIFKTLPTERSLTVCAASEKRATTSPGSRSMVREEDRSVLFDSSEPSPIGALSHSTDEARRQTAATQEQTIEAKR